MSRYPLRGRLAIDANQRVVELDHDAEEFLATTQERALGRYCYDVIGGGAPSGTSACGPACGAFAALRHGQISGVCEMRSETEPGRRLSCRLTALPRSTGGALLLLSERLDAGADPPSAADEAGAGDLVDKLAALATLITTLSEDDLNHGLQRASDLARTATGADVAEVFLTEPAATSMVLTCHKGGFRREFGQQLRFDEGEGIPGLVLAAGEPVISSPLDCDDRYLRYRVKEAGFHAYLATPLRHAHGVVGAICLAFKQPTEDTCLQRAQEYLGWLSGPLGTAVQAALAGPFAPLVSSNSNRDGADATVERLLEQLMGASGARAGEVRLVCQTAESSEPEPRLTLGSLPGGCAPVRSGRLADCPVLSRGRGEALCGRTDQWPGPCRGARSGGGLRLCVPIADGEGPVGLVRLWRPQPTGDLPTRDLALAEAIAAAAAPLLREERALAEAERKARALFFRLPTRAHQAGPEPIARAPRSPRLQVWCFGSFQVSVNGVPVLPHEVGRKRALTLFKILVAHGGRVVPRDALLEWLWPEGNPAGKASQLHVLVHELRRLLEPAGPGPVHVLGRDGGYAFATSAAARVDEQEFRALVRASVEAEARQDIRTAVAAGEAAVDLYRGDFMEDEPYADWCWQDREELREVCLETLQRLAALAGEAGQWERSVNHLRRAIRLDPLREANHRNLMQALWAIGRHDEAMQQYRNCEEMLRRELDVLPLPETTRLVNRIRLGR